MREARKFRAKSSVTKAANLNTPMRGGYRF